MKTRLNGIEDSVDSRDVRCICYIRLLFIFTSLFLIATISSFLPFVFCIELNKKEEYLSRCMRAADSLRFCKFYGEIPIMRIARITVSSKITKSRTPTIFHSPSMATARSPHAESRKVNRTVSLLGLISQTSSTR